VHTALEGDGGHGRWIALGLVVSLGLHALVAGGISRIPERARSAARWVEMAVHQVEQPKPEPQPEPEPEPEPEPKPPETVEYQPETPQPQPPTPVQPTPRPIQGLNNQSFLPGSGSGLQVRQGNTTAAQATKEQLDTDVSVPIPYASVTTPPKIRYKPVLEVPPAVKEAKLQGRVELLLTIDAAGKVSDIEVLQGLHPDADEACKAALRSSRWKAGEKDGAPVVTLKVPYSCKFEMTLD
jgi:protein TonB